MSNFEKFILRLADCEVVRDVGRANGRLRNRSGETIIF